MEYLEDKRGQDELGMDGKRITAALELFWRERAEKAPAAEELKRHIREQEEYVEAIRKGNVR